MLCACEQTADNSSKLNMLPYYSEASFTPHWFTSNHPDLNDFHKIPSFSLLNQNGEEVSSESLENKIYLANFFFTTCPGICPKLTANMYLIQEEFLDDSTIILLSHTVTPHMDSVEVLANYAESNGVVHNKWHLLTGERAEIYNLGRNAYFIEEDLRIEKSDDDFLHTENIVLVDKNKYIRGIYNGLNATAIQQLISDVKLLKEE